jgi:tRNA (adenine-N(1)-)-methyltransferase non-catalytic subunit
MHALYHYSDTWGSKTEFAQEKWLKRKHKKYIRRMRIMKSSPATICEVYHNKSRDKICGMRWDTLAQVLSHSGVSSSSRVLVFETLTGLIVGSLAYKLRGHGIILAAFAGQQPHFEIVDALNLGDDDINAIQTVPSEEIGPAAAEVKANGFVVPAEQESSSGKDNSKGSNSSGSAASSELLPLPAEETGVVTTASDKDSTSTNIAPAPSSASASTVTESAVEVTAESTSTRNEATASGASADDSTKPTPKWVKKPKDAVKEPPRPHHSSGRQVESLSIVRRELRQGADRYTIHHVNLYLLSLSFCRLFLLAIIPSYLVVNILGFML